jgi:hypothetical protein
MKSDSHRGYILPQAQIESYEPVLSTLDLFESYEQFKSKFDTFFITEELIKKLWEGTSAQHGEKYKPSDFKSIGPSGKEALRQLLLGFKGVTSTDTFGYRESTSVDGHIHYRVRDGFCQGSGGSSSSRDVSVSHTLGKNLVHYSSERHGTGNGTYGLIANKNTYLWLEND